MSKTIEISDMTASNLDEINGVEFSGKAIDADVVRYLVDEYVAENSDDYHVSVVGEIQQKGE